MSDDRLQAAVTLLRQCKAEGQTYYAATQTLQKQGYSSAEIEQASYQFPYSDISLPDSSGTISPSPSRTASSDMQQLELQDAKETLRQDSWMQFIPIVGRFYALKVDKDYVNYESMKTGYPRYVVIGIMIFIMLLGAVLVQVIPDMLLEMGVNNNMVLYLSHYIGVGLIFLTLIFVFRHNKSK